MKIYAFNLFIVLVAIIVSSCSSSDDQTTPETITATASPSPIVSTRVQTPTSTTPQAVKHGDYVTMTFSQYVTDENQGDIKTQLLSYDTTTNEMEKVFEFDYSSQYPLGYYDKQNHQVYYTKRVGDETNYGDQIFVTDLTDNKETQLTDEFFAVNFIIPTKDFIFFVACPKGSRSDRLGSIDKATGKLTYWKDEDTSIEAIVVDQIKKMIIVSTYSMKERDYNVIHQEGPAGQDNYKMPKHTVYQMSYDFKTTKDLLCENKWIRTVMTNGDQVIALVDNKYNNAQTPSSVYTYDLTNEKWTTQTWTSERMQVGDAGYSSDGKRIYAIAVQNDKRGLYVYDLETQKYTSIFTPSYGFINNIQVVRSGP